MKKPMKVVPDRLYPPEVKTPEEQMEHLGRRLFAVTPEEMKKREAEYQKAKSKKP
jgi:hypothetical protein